MVLNIQPIFGEEKITVNNFSLHQFIVFTRNSTTKHTTGNENRCA